MIMTDTDKEVILLTRSCIVKPIVFSEIILCWLCASTNANKPLQINTNRDKRNSDLLPCAYNLSNLICTLLFSQQWMFS
jgi:hypothetical protein